MFLHNPLLSTLVIAEAAEEDASQRGGGIKFNGLAFQIFIPCCRYFRRCRPENGCRNANLRGSDFFPDQNPARAVKTGVGEQTASMYITAVQITTQMAINSLGNWLVVYAQSSHN